MNWIVKNQEPEAPPEKFEDRMAKQQETVDERGRARKISVKGRHDACICPRVVPVAEAMAALVLMDAIMAQKAREK